MVAFTRGANGLLLGRGGVLAPLNGLIDFESMHSLSSAMGKVQLRECRAPLALPDLCKRRTGFIMRPPQPEIHQGLIARSCSTQRVGQKQKCCFIDACSRLNRKES